ncbi:MAG TPA: hypothetical protein VK474_03395 [Chthoniobacterales bacterium]|nr:hypothetical protein [Chthoniobacterales bacterium]
MRLASLSFALCAALLTGCANQGVIVQKDSGPQPFYHSLGIDGSYVFLLRDQAGTTHRQLVTPDVFERYAVGDYFNDLQPGPSRPRSVDPKDMQTAMGSRETARPIARVHKATTKVRRLATKKHPAHKPLAQRKHTRRIAQAKVMAHVQQSPRVASVTESEFLLLNLVRCR